MFRSLHMKLVLIMVLLIVSLMTVVGAFLMNSVVRFYVNDFYQQINRVTSQADFTAALTVQTEAEASGDTTAAAQIEDRLRLYVGELGVDGRNRNYYILDGVTAKVLVCSGSEDGVLNITPNIEAALQGRDGTGSDLSTDYMDVALCFTRGEHPYIFYILDLRETVRGLNSELFSLILEALMLGLIISVLLSLLLSKTMTTPIERLTEGAKQVASGDFGHKLEVGSRDEIGVLTENFNSMAKQLRDTLDAVEDERNKLNTLFLYMTDGVVAFDHGGQIMHWNPAAVEMLGQKIDGSTSYPQLFGGPPPTEDLVAAGRDGYVEQSLTVGEKKLECICALFDRGGQEGVLVVIHDVTERLRVEEQRREFVANVSHELRTPLTNIRSYAETLAEGGAELPPEMEQSFLNVILNESDRMTHIVSDLLTLSRFDSGHSELRLDRFSFSQAVKDTYRAVLLDAQNHGHTLTLDLEPEIPDILGDRERILQVMMNILSNAIKYTPDGGLIRLRGGRQGARVWLETDDNGIGIPAKDRDRIFERFYRVDKARSRQSGGTGLGLSIAKEIVDRHKGSLTLVDKDGPGLTIRLELPIDGPGEGAA